VCGICGFVAAPERATLERMTASLRHRGPDDVGFKETGEVSLGMRRLAIVDLDSGRQPVSNEDGTVWVVFNGEIYNHVELRAELEAAGHRFRSDHSDTEVLVHLYEELGPDYLHRLNGMFGIALWDERRRELHLARDRAGIKPLFFAQVGRELLFGSEIKAILAHPCVQRRPNFAALHHYFTFKNVPAPWTAFAGIEQLHAGERAVFRDGELARTRWWQLRFEEDRSLTEPDAAACIRQLLRDSVRLRMRSDVPFGAYLSGGVDSSAVVALMSDLGARRVKTFSLVYEDRFAYKEPDREFARLVSQRCDTDHHEHVMTAAEVGETIESVLAAFDEPYSGVTSTYFLTALIARHVKVALSGDGADELFASYAGPRLAQPLDRFGALRERGAADLSGEDRDALAPYADRLELLAATWARGDEAARRMGQYLWDDRDKDALYSPTMRGLTRGADSESLVRHLYQTAGSADPLNRALRVDFETLLPDQVLAFVDRLSMAHSVEVRPPFLDYRLMEFSATLPGSMKIKRGRVKHILKEAVRGLIPDEIVDRPKEGFILPVNDWLLTGLRPYVDELLSPERIAQTGLLEPTFVRALVDDHYLGRAQNGPRIWNLMMFQAWWERYFG
jgi:asparagine synthase (glutamine-hydrolysing)